MTATTGVLQGLGGPAAAWLLTYWLQSSLLLGSAWVLGRWVLKREAWRDVMWKAALVGGLITSMVSMTLRPWGARLTVALPAAQSTVAVVDQENGPELSVPTSASASPTPGASASPSPSTTSATEATPPLPRTQPTSALESRETVALSAGSGRGSTSSLRGPGVAALSSVMSGRASELLLGVWSLIAALLLGGLLRRHVRLHRILKDRRMVSEGPLPGILAALRRSTGVWRSVRLSATPSVATPLALGRGEICVPERFLGSLQEEEQRAALAHELGHIVRRDPEWNLIAQVMESLFFFQPLNRVARTKLRESAELLSDAWAVQETGSRLGLARCLAKVAHWVSVVEPSELAGSVAMAEGGSPMLVRVRRLLEGEPEATRASGAVRLAALSLVGVTAAFAPAVSSSAATLLEASNEPESMPQEAVTQTVEVVRVVATGTLQDRMRAAAEQASGSGARAYWLAYVVEGNVGVGEHVALDSGPWEGWPDGGPAVEGLLRVASEVGPAGSGDMLVLAQAAPGASRTRLVRVALRTPGIGMDLQGRPVYWLGRASAQESFEWARGVFDDEGNAGDIREGGLEILSYHELPAARDYLERVATSNASPTIREEAVEGLAHHPEDATVDLLARLAADDRDPVVQEEAAETLGELANARASMALQSLIRSSGSSAMKEEALEALGERADTILAALLLDIALRDPDADMRMEAVERMEDLPPEEALPVLRRVLAESNDREVRLEAIETVGEIGTSDALAVLDALVNDRDREIALQVVESIAEFPEELAGPRLSQIARQHPIQEVREEAIDALSEIGGSALTADALLDLALNASDMEMRAHAVEEMENLPADQATALLARVLAESRDIGTRVQAAETLGEVGTNEALQILDRLVRESTDEGLAVQAVESIGEFPEDVAGPILRRIATEHPSRRVRREALDQLGG